MGGFFGSVEIQVGWVMDLVKSSATRHYIGVVSVWGAPLMKNFNLNNSSTRSMPVYHSF